MFLRKSLNSLKILGCDIDPLLVLKASDPQFATILADVDQFAIIHNMWADRLEWLANKVKERVKIVLTPPTKSP